MTFDPEELDRSKGDLAAILRKLRKRAGLTGDRLARRCHMSQSKISKIETGNLAPSLVDVELILKALNASQQEIAEITALARTANTEWQDIRASWRRGLEKRQAELASLEASASEFRYFLPAMITGLLATPEYVRASLEYSPGNTSKTIARKLKRQGILHDTSKTFTFLLTEQAVRWAVVSPREMVVQLDRLASLSRLPNITVGIVPFSAPISRGPMNTFTLYDRTLCTVETFTGRIVYRDRRDIDEHLEIFDMYGQNALYDNDCRDFLGARTRDLLRDL